MKRHLSQRSVTALLLLFLILCASVWFAGSVLFHEDASETAAVEPAAKEVSPAKDIPDVPLKKTPVHLSQHIVEYHISVQLDATEKKLSGAQTFSWKNTGKNPVKELYFHLYPNAFQSKKTTFNKESGGKLRSDQMKEDSYGRMDITAVKTAEGDDLLPFIQYVQPDDGNKHDQTLIKIRLPQPVLPDEKVTLQMNFTVKLPYVFARMGYAGDFVMAGQWFPKVAVYEPAGTRGRKTEGWNLHQYHGNSEFYSDFGIYNVRIKVPSDYTVAATGFPAKPPVQEGKTKTYHFYADDVHDFAWAASPHFVYAEEPYSAPNVPGVRIKLYLDPKHKALKSRYLIAAKKALARYSEWYGPYPYSTLSIVVPPEGGNGAGGMEYPSLITAWSASDEKPDLELERVIVHEIGHQFWYGMVASNEFEEAWLDEGFTSYAEDKLMEREYDVKTNAPVVSSFITSPAPLHQLSWQYGSHARYADNVYTRAKLVLKDIERQIGEKQMNKVLKTYFERWKFRHPGTADFQKTLEDVTKKSWSDYFNQFVYGGQMIDYSVESIQTKPIQQEGLTVYENAVLLQKRGGSYSPVPVVFHFGDGTSMVKMWNGQDTSIRYKFVHPSPVAWVAIDPNYTMMLENKHINNFLKNDVDKTWRVRWTLGAVKFIEALLGMVAW